MAVSTAAVALVALVVVPGSWVAYSALRDGVSMESALDEKEPWQMWAGQAAMWGGFCVLVGGIVAAGLVVGSFSLATIGLGRPVPGQVGFGVAAGVAVFAVSRVTATLCTAAGISSAGGIAHLMEPETTAGIGGFAAATVVESTGEEVAFRAVLVGALAAVLGVSPWWLVAPAAVVFGAGHATEGRSAGVVTAVGGLGFGAAFVASGLVAAAAAHAVANVVELLAVTVLDWDHVHAPA
jgi:membrane protease YdiL (CAAX protease family)